MSEAVLEHTPNAIKSLRPDNFVLSRFANRMVGAPSGLIKDLYDLWQIDPDDPDSTYGTLGEVQVWSKLPFEVVATVFKDIEEGSVENFEEAVVVLGNSLRFEAAGSKGDPIAEDMSSYTQDVGFFLCVLQEWMARGEGREVTPKMIEEIKFIKEGVEGKEAWQRGDHKLVSTIKNRLNLFDTWVKMHSSESKVE